MATRVSAIASYLPERVVSNDELALRLGVTSTWIEERTGIQQRRYAAEDETTSGLAVKAAKRLREESGRDFQDVDAIIFATLSPDAAFPGSGVFFQAELGISQVPTLDVRNQCSGFLYGLSVAHAWIAAGMYRRVLLAASEIHSTGLDYSEEGQTITPLFGDGAAVAWIEHGDEVGLVDVKLGADGRGAHHLWCQAPGSRLRPSLNEDHLASGLHFPSMNGRAVFRRAVETLEREIKAMMQTHGLAPADILLVPHQANQRISEAVAQRLKLANDQVVHTIATYGNTTAASIPMAWAKAREEARTEGKPVILAAFGSGFSWGTALYRE